MEAAFYNLCKSEAKVFMQQRSIFNRMKFTSHFEFEILKNENV